MKSISYKNPVFAYKFANDPGAIPVLLLEYFQLPHNLFPWSNIRPMSPLAESSPTCLCVELDPDFYYLIQSYAGRSGLRAAHVGRGVETLSAVHQIRPAVICLEPEHHADETAWEVLRALKADPLAAAIPVILFSWLEEEEKARVAGAAVYVRKPVMYVDFLDALAAAGFRHENQEKSSK